MKHITKLLDNGLELHYDVIDNNTIEIKLPPRCGQQGFFLLL